MNFYFFNSYQQSPVGYQLSLLSQDAEQLTFISAQDIPSDEFRSVITNSGNSCVIGCADDTAYLTIRGLSVTDADSQQWYINLGVTANKVDKDDFIGLIKKIFLDYSGFQNSLKDWFYAVADQRKSYAINPDALRRWLDTPCAELEQISFYQADNPIIRQFRDMLKKAEAGIHRRLFLLVPENSVAFFFTQNPLFEGELPNYLFNDREFQQLLLQETPLTEESAEQEKSAPPIWEQLGITKEQFIGYVATGVIACAGFLAMISHFIRKHRIPSNHRRFF